MTSLEGRPAFDSTSAAGAMIRQLREPVVLGCILAGLGTSAMVMPPREEVLRVQRPMDQTTAGAPARAAKTAGASIGELRRLTGFTWDQLARLFDVSRRSLHFWASGKQMTPRNEEHLQRLLAVMRKIDRGSAGANRSALVSAYQDGMIPLDMLAARDYEGVVKLVGVGDAGRVGPPKPTDKTVAARAPRPPEELVGALQDRVHREGGRVRAGRSVRVRSGG